MAYQDYATFAGDLAGLEAFMPAAKKGLIVAINNEWDRVDDDADELSFDAKNVLAVEQNRLCETGTVTLHKDDRKAEAIFQTNFGTAVPQVLYGISGYQFDLRARGVSHYGGQTFGGYGGYGGYSQGPSYGGYGYHYEPNAIGVFVTQTSSPDSVTFEAVNMAFGDTELLTVTVSYQACNVGPILEVGRDE